MILPRLSLSYIILAFLGSGSLKLNWNGRSMGLLVVVARCASLPLKT